MRAAVGASRAELACAARVLHKGVRASLPGNFYKTDTGFSDPGIGGNRLTSFPKHRVNRFYRRVQQTRASLRIGRRGVALFLLIVGSAAAAWYWTSLGEGITLNSLIDDAAVWRDHPLALAVVVAAYVLAGLAVVPV